MLQEDQQITKTIEGLALEKFGSTANYREVLDSLNSLPFPSDLLPELETFDISMIQNPEEINAKIKEAKEKVDAIITQAEDSLKNTISKMNWLF